MSFRQRSLLGGGPNIEITFDIPGLTSTLETIFTAAGNYLNLWALTIDATLNLQQDVTVRGYDDISGDVVIGTALADWFFPCPAGEVITYNFSHTESSPDGAAVVDALGLPICVENNELTMMCCTEAGGLAGATNPSGLVRVRAQFEDGSS